jgi:hypothetical protein
VRFSRWFCLLLIALPVPAAAQATVEEEFHKHWPDFRYLEPGKIRELPVAVRTDLAKLGCRIPKFIKWDARHNVIQGQFFRAGQQDWAVLCKVGDKTGILLYPGGIATELPMLRAEPNDPARTIHAVSAFVLQKRSVRDHPDEPPPAFDHDAIEDGPIQKAGRIIYYSEDEWAEF